MISAGLHLNDLNMFDSTSDLLITALQQERAIEEAIETVRNHSVWITTFLVTLWVSWHSQALMCYRIGFSNKFRYKNHRKPRRTWYNGARKANNYCTLFYRNTSPFCCSRVCNRIASVKYILSSYRLNIPFVSSSLSDHLVTSTGYGSLHLSDGFQISYGSTWSCSHHYAFERNHRNIRSDRRRLRCLQGRNKSWRKLYGRGRSQWSIPHRFQRNDNIHGKDTVPPLRSALLYSVDSQQMMSLGHYKDDLDEETPDKIDKNPLGLHQTEIIALLAIDLLNASQKIINPLTNQPFSVKFG